MMYDIVILTDSRYVNPTEIDDYTANVLLEDDLVKKACEEVGLKVYRTNWDNPDFDWSTTKSVLFRTTWDYFDRFPEFSKWLDNVSSKTTLLNSNEIIRWNIDKHYLNDLKASGINVVETIFKEVGEVDSLKEIAEKHQLNNFVVKPVVSGGGRHTYKLNVQNTDAVEEIYTELIYGEAMMIQPYINSITEKGEVSYMVFGGKFSHAILKKAKSGDFRVQDDFGGSIQDYFPSIEEIAFAESVIEKCSYDPIYARVDVVWDNNNELAIAELELIEPELWFRKNENSAILLANEIKNVLMLSCNN